MCPGYGRWLDEMGPDRYLPDIFGSVCRAHQYKPGSPILEDISLASEIITQLEQGERGIPILIKQYIKLGGRFLEFNVDKEFNDALDGLIVVDLRETEKELLEYFMGKDNAENYLTAIKPLSPALKQA